MSSFPEILTQTDVPVPVVSPIPQAMSAPFLHSPTWFQAWLQPRLPFS